MWDPIHQFKDEWEATNCVWGKGRVLFFHAMVWPIIGACMAWFVVPNTYYLGWLGCWTTTTSTNTPKESLTSNRSE